MAVRRAGAPFGSGASGADDDVAVVVEGLSKRYPVSRVNLFPPVVSVFDRGLFKRNRSSEDQEETSDESSSPNARASRPAPAPQPEIDLYDEDDDLDEEDDDDLVEEPSAGKTTPMRPGEMFWALKDISFRVRQGRALGVLGGPGSGKSALLRILAGQAFPTEGRVLVRDPVSAWPEALAKGLAMSGSGTFDFDLVLGSRLLAVEPDALKPHRIEIEALASPLRTDEGDPAPGALLRLGIATASVLPWSVILLEEHPGVDEVFMAQIVERLRERLGRGSALVFASRKPQVVAELCDEAIVLSEGSVIAQGAAKDVLGAYQVPPKAGRAGRRPGGKGTAAGVAAGGHLSDGRPLHVPPVVPAFNGSIALLSATLSSAGGSSKRIDAESELSVEIRLETAVPDVEAHCGIGFTPRNGDGTGIRLEHPEPLRFVDPGTYVLVARTPPGALRTGAYEAKADAVVAHPSEQEATVIRRDIGRVRIVGDEMGADEPIDPPVQHWDGRHSWRVESEWSIVE